MATPDKQRVLDKLPGVRGLGRVLLLVSIVLLLLFAASFALLWQLEVFDANTRKSNAQILAAALGLVGVFVTGALTFIGVLLKHSIDLRTAQQAAETEGRLRLETSIRAVELIAEEGETTAETRRAGALFVLANLNQFDFALALLTQMWANREISPRAASWVVDRLLLSGNPVVEFSAASLLSNRADALAVPPSGFIFPACASYRWPSRVSRTARETLLTALMKLFLSRPRQDLDDSVLNGLIVQLNIIRNEDDVDYIRNGALVCLDALFHVYETQPGFVIRALDDKVPVDDLRAEVRTLVASGGEVITRHRNLANQLRAEWASSELEVNGSAFAQDRSVDRLGWITIRSGAVVLLLLGLAFRGLARRLRFVA